MFVLPPAQNEPAGQALHSAAEARLVADEYVPGPHGVSVLNLVPSGQ